MKYLIFPSILVLALTVASAHAQSPADHEAHHPAPAAASATPAEAQPAVDGMQTSKGMGDMPMMKMIKMMRDV